MYPSLFNFVDSKAGGASNAKYLGGLAQKDR
jgi:hypothetical protein